MDQESRISEGLSFDDVILKPAKSDVLPRDVDITTRVTRNITLNIPVLSSAMDTVTEAHMAIAIAQEGGMGVIHRNLTIEAQAAEIDLVKRSQSGIISNPFTLSPEHLVQDAEDLMARYHVSGVPITDKDGKLVGILTNRDLRFQEDFSATIGSVMTKDNLVTVPPGTTLEEAKQHLHKHRIEKLPIVEEDGTLVGLLTIKDINKARDYPQRCVDELSRLRVAAAIGASPQDLDRANALVEAQVDVLVVDTAHGHSQAVIEMVEKMKDAFPRVDVIAGNVVTPEGAADLIAAGADAVKVGVGPGSICTTRVVTGTGMPQLTAILEVVEEAEKHDVPVIADGGIKYSGDITKAIAAGAHCVMIGGLFAGTDESPGEKVLYEGRTYKVYRGMGSLRAMERGSKSRYRQESTHDISKLVPEGVEGRVPYRGDLASSIHQLIGGLRAGMGYCGVANITNLRTRTHFIRVTDAALREAHPHDVTITEEPPNYHLLH